MNRVKEMHEEKYQRQLLAEKKEAKRQEKIREEVRAERYSWRTEYIAEEMTTNTAYPQIDKEVKALRKKPRDWREELNTDLKKYHHWYDEVEPIKEGMTTANLGMINLEPEIGDLQSNPVGSSSAYSQSDNASFGGSTVTFNFSGSPEVGNTYSRNAYFKPTDATQFDTFVTNVNVGSGPSQWYEPREGDPTHSFPGGFRLVMYPKSRENDFNAYFVTELTSGTTTVTIPLSHRVSDLVVYYIGWANSDPLNGGVTQPDIVSSASFQRRTPMNVFVSLDDPESIPFHRGGLGGDKEKRKQLQKMIEAANEWMIQNGLEPSKVTPGDIQIAQGLPYVDEDDAYDDDYYQGPVPDYMDDSDVDLPIELANAGPSTPVKPDSDGRLVPNQGGGRPGKVRLKPGMLPTA